MNSLKTDSYHKDMQALLRQERSNNTSYGFNNSMLRQHILRKEYKDPSFAQSCFPKEINSRLSFL